MRLPVPLVKLPLRFDVGRLVREVCALGPADWVNHPGGNQASRNIILVSRGGQKNDDFAASGTMAMTPALRKSPYLQQVLASFDAPVTRCRLTNLGARGVVGPHEDANYHWFRRTRIHVPIISSPSVLFRCGDRTEHMAPGEAWIFDNFRIHSVRNSSLEPRIHLILDTRGSKRFWEMVRRAITEGIDVRPAFVPFVPTSRRRPRLEGYSFEVPMPSEFDRLVNDVVDGLPAAIPDESERREIALRLGECATAWKRLYSTYGRRKAGRRHYARLLDDLVAVAAESGLKRRLRPQSDAYGSLAVLSTVFQTTNRIVGLDGEALLTTPANLPAQVAAN